MQDFKGFESVRVSSQFKDVYKNVIHYKCLLWSKHTKEVVQATKKICPYDWYYNIKCFRNI